MSERHHRAPVILHLAVRSDWEVAQERGEYRAPTLATEGFVHCSDPVQLLGPANSFFRGRRDLVLLYLESARLPTGVIYEDCRDEGQAYPHVYGPIPLDAVRRVEEFQPGEDGLFSQPPAP